jgi:hypothetical protein
MARRQPISYMHSHTKAEWRMHLLPAAQHVLVRHAASWLHMLSPPHSWPCCAISAHAAGGAPGVSGGGVAWPPCNGIIGGGGGSLVSLLKESMVVASDGGLLLGGPCQWWRWPRTWWRPCSWWFPHQWRCPPRWRFGHTWWQSCTWWWWPCTWRRPCLRWIPSRGMVGRTGGGSFARGGVRTHIYRWWPRARWWPHPWWRWPL